MSSLKAQVLLGKVSLYYEQKKFEIPKNKIKERIDHLKYISTQKNIPKLTLRKSILHLEDQLKSIYDIEKSLLKQKNRESTKIASLKRELKMVKSSAAYDKSLDLQKKVDKLTHLLGEALANHTTNVEVSSANKQILQERKIIPARLVPVINDQDKQNKLIMLQQRFNMLKQELAIKEHLEVAPEELEKIEQQVKLFEEKMRSLGYVRAKPKHTMLLNLPRKARLDIEKNLPLPPPQKQEI